FQQKTEYFYKLWVGKEAFIKALGKGWLEREEVINSLTILPYELFSQSEGILKMPQGILHYFNVVPQYESAFFSNGHSLKPRIFNFM
ncbi:MAG: 4'-phosphopantetheinyl transferase superfamily protein, partial [Alphaproteobacteria bacterium]|nr:4'-phosphopantetheinyl transferase superfamily protein [Alphaproteobacteria bacterium]